MKIGIIAGSVREGRRGLGVAEWALGVAQQREDAEYVLLDLASFDVPLLTTSVMPMVANKSYDDAGTQAWSDAVDACDAFLFVTPEYNHGVPGAFKNAVDSLGPEWSGKAVGFIGYGSVGGVRAIEQWRTIVANFSMVGVRAELNLGLFTDFSRTDFSPGERRAAELGGVLDQVVAAAKRQLA